MVRLAADKEEEAKRLSDRLAALQNDVKTTRNEVELKDVELERLKGELETRETNLKARNRDDEKCIGEKERRSEGRRSRIGAVATRISGEGENDCRHDEGKRQREGGNRENRRGKRQIDSELRAALETKNEDVEKLEKRVDEMTRISSALETKETEFKIGKNGRKSDERKRNDVRRIKTFIRRERKTRIHSNTQGRRIKKTRREIASNRSGRDVERSAIRSGVDGSERASRTRTRTRRGASESNRSAGNGKECRLSRKWRANTDNSIATR